MNIIPMDAQILKNFSVLDYGYTNLFVQVNSYVVDFSRTGKFLFFVGQVHHSGLHYALDLYGAKTALFSKEHFAQVRITDVRKVKLGDIPLEDMWRKGYDALEALKEE